jgi:aminoglycoside 6'-N-acetyltransferase I
MQIRPVETRDRAAWLRMRQELWSDETGLDTGVDDYFKNLAANPNLQIITLVAQTPDGKLVGFAEVDTRAYAEDCETSPVGFLEGWYVQPEARGSGVGRALMSAAETWAREQGLQEFASDTWLHNETGIRAHLALGFSEAERLVCFRKSL